MDSGWGKLKRFISERFFVHKVDPKYTSLKCSSCDHVSNDNKKTQSKFKRMSYDLDMNADYNVSLNILALGRETIKTDVREYSVPLINGIYSLNLLNNTWCSSGHSCM